MTRKNNTLRVIPESSQELIRDPGHIRFNQSLGPGSPLRSGRDDT